MTVKQNIFLPSPISQIKAEIYFGMNIPGGEQVTAPDWDRFLADSVTPHFPGFTVDSSTGYWKGEREQMRRVTILMDDTAANRGQCQWIAEHYKSDFNQEAVGISFTPCVYTMETWPNGPVRLYHQLDKGTAA